jgi:hypothetical protein
MYGTDYQDPAITKTLHSPDDAVIELAQFYRPQRAGKSSQEYSDAIATHKGFCASFQMAERFPACLAVMLCKLLNPDHPQLRQLPAGETSCVNVPQSFVDEYLSLKGVSTVKIYKELKIVIQDNTGALRVRTHNLYRGKKPPRDIIVRSPSGE